MFTAALFKVSIERRLSLIHIFVNTGGSDYYQSKLDPVLDDPSNELYPDMMGLEVDYVQKLSLIHIWKGTDERTD